MGNYIQVYYSTESGVSKKIVRSTLKDVMNTLEGGTFLKCHRSFVVNMSFVKGYSGNTKGMKLEVEGIKDPIQVSRQYMQPIREWIETKDDH